MVWILTAKAGLQPTTQPISYYLQHSLSLGFGSRVCLTGNRNERHIKINSSQNYTPYTFFLARIDFRYVVFELSVSLLEQAQSLLTNYFDSLEAGEIRGKNSKSDPINAIDFSSYTIPLYRIYRQNPGQLSVTSAI